VIEDSFWAPKALLDEVGQALQATDHLRGHVSANEVAVLYPIGDANEGEFTGPRWANASAYVEFGAIPEVQRIPYWRVIREIAQAGIPFDSIALPEEQARTNDVTALRLARYRYVVLPACHTVSAVQHAELLAYARTGGNVIVVDDYGSSLGPVAAAELTGLAANVARGVSAASAITDRQTVLPPGSDLGINLVALDQSDALHLVNYSYDVDRDQTIRLEDVRVEVRLARPAATATIHRPGESPVQVPVLLADGRAVVVLDHLDIYAGIELN
jgi:hypothetical protein